ncbi:HD-GYP domain-containing protein [Alcaligenes sp.]|uniref:HD-GYP domain-containing protein n=1 Tax=Alcaligenes sp. TaxID=512 RepID=UPI003CFFF9F7
MKLLSRMMKSLERRVDQAAPLHKSLLHSLLVMAWTVEARDPYTGGHLWRVSRYARLLAEQSGLSEEDTARIAIGGFLHDLGKIAIPDHILNKKDRLTQEEYETIKTHPEIGWRVISGHPLAALAEAGILYHHERPDGTGYPRGLRSAAIPEDARIIGICDAFDAMTSTRPYRKGMSKEDALSAIEQNQGKQFDHALSNHFLAVADTGKLDHIIGHSDEGIPLRNCVVCGPTLVFKRHQQANDYVYCRSCAAEYRTEACNGDLVATPTGKRGQPWQLQPELDTTTIDALIQQSLPALSELSIAR